MLQWEWLLYAQKNTQSSLQCAAHGTFLGIGGPRCHQGTDVCQCCGGDKHLTTMVLESSWRLSTMGMPPTHLAPRGAFPCGDTSEAKCHQCHHMPALPAAVTNGKELPKEHLVSGQGWFSLVPFTCSRNSEVTDGSVYCIAVASPASFALIQVWQHRTIPPIHKILGFSLFPLTLGFEWYWFILMNGLAILWQITRWHGVRGREAKPFFFLLQFSPKLGVNYGLQLMMKCWGCRNILLTQQKEQSTSFS